MRLQPQEIASDTILCNLYEIDEIDMGVFQNYFFVTEPHLMRLFQYTDITKYKITVLLHSLGGHGRTS